MNFAKKTTLVLLTPIFLALLFTTALDFGILRIAGHPGSIKKVIADSGVYNNVVSNALNQAQNGANGDINLADPAIKTAANKALTPQVLQSSTNQIIDGVYSWLDGKTTQPNFNVDLSGAKASFADYVSQAAEAKASSLPACSGVLAANFDVFNADCLPAGITPAQAADQAKSSILSGQGFLDNPVISAGNFKDSNNQNIFDTKLKNAPKQYQRAKKTPYILAVLAVLIGIALVFLRASWQSGLRHVGVVLLVVGLLMFAFAYGLHKVIDDKLVTQLKFDNTLLQADARSLITDLSSTIERNYYGFGIIYALLGLLAFAAPTAAARLSHAPAAAAPEKTEAQTDAPAKPKPKKPSKKIDL